MNNYEGKDYGNIYPANSFSNLMQLTFRLITFNKIAVEKFIGSTEN